MLWFHALSVRESLALLPLIDLAIANDEAAILVHNKAQLSQSVARLFDAEERAPLVEAAREVIKARRGVLETTWSAILQAL